MNLIAPHVLLIAGLNYKGQIRTAISQFSSFLTSTTYIFLNSRDVTNVKARWREVSAALRFSEVVHP